jgi:gluconate 2-dehydrogenase gamma chain
VKKPGASSAVDLRRRRLLVSFAALAGGAFSGIAACKRVEPEAEAASAAPAPNAKGAGGAAPDRLAVAGERSPSFVPQVFSREQALAVEDLAELIVPETDTPGARRAGVPAFIEDQVRDVLEEEDQKRVLAGLGELDRAARAAHGKAFHACNPEQQGAQLGALVAAVQAVLAENDWPEPSPWFWAFYELVIEGYCRSKLGATRTLQYEPVPGDYEACVPLSSVGRAWALN